MSCYGEHNDVPGTTTQGWSAFVSQEQKQKLADALEKVQFKGGQKLFSAGEAGDRCFLLRSGAVRITTSTGAQRRVEKAHCLGERALIADDIRSIPFICIPKIQR